MTEPTPDLAAIRQQCGYTAVDLERERDEARAEVERLSAENAELRSESIRMSLAFANTDEERERLSAALARVRELCWCGAVDPQHGCCSACDGTGMSNDPNTGGRCADCYATGHSHGPAECEPDFIAAIQRAARLSLPTEGATRE